NYNPANPDSDAIVNENQAKGNESWYAEESCNDGVSAASAKGAYYMDSDADGYGDPNEAVQSCTRPQGYVTDNTDCDDNDALEHPGQTWYKDTDGDGYSDGTTNTSSCLRPSSAFKSASSLTATSGDCKDNDKAVSPGATEGAAGDTTCRDGKDNDCDGFQDLKDSNCIASGKDLLITSVSNLPTAKKRGRDFSFNVTVLNQGGQAAGKSVIRYYLSKNAVKGDGDDFPLRGSNPAPKLKSGKFARGNPVVTVPRTISPDYYYLIACIDEANKVSESNEDNNCTASATTMQVK
ncbi:MAG: CARDB domain-containing protein, partial [Nitrospirota bacterium]